MSSPLDPHFNPHELPLIRSNLEKVEEEMDLKKFEEEMKKVRKVDPDQKKERKRKQEEAEGKEKIIQDAQMLIENQGDSLYAIQRADIKHLLKKKKSTELAETPFLLPSPLQSASNLFEEKAFSLNLAEPPSEWIAKQKNMPSFIAPSETLPSSFETPVLKEEFTIEPPQVTQTPILIKKVPPPPKEESEPSIALEQKQPTTTSKFPSKKISPIAESLLAVPVFEFIPFAFSSPPDLATADSNLHRLSPTFFALLERIIGTITLLQASKGSSKTTFCLNQPQFASSVFFGAEITIEECDHAPKEFNIRFMGSAEAVKAFSLQQQELENSFTEGSKEGRFHFKVHRIETELLS